MDKNGNVLTFNIFKNKKIICALSTKNLGSIKTYSKINEKNLRRFSKALEINSKNIVFPQQTHSSNILFIDSLNNVFPQDTDGLITDKKNIFLGILTADCLPICFYASDKNLVGIIHAGYKGILAGIIDKTIYRFKKLGVDIKLLKVGIGPGIGVCCYDVDYERIKMFKEKLGRLLSYKNKDNKYYLNLKNTAKNILLEKGVLKNNLEILPFCTKCDQDRFYSFRGNCRKTAGRFATIIGKVV